MDNKAIRFIKQAIMDEKMKVLDGSGIDWARVRRLEEWLLAEMVTRAEIDMELVRLK